MAKQTTKLAKSNANSTAIVRWEDELAKFATEAADKEVTPSGSFISLKGGILTVAGQPVAGNKALVLIVDHVFENSKYTGDYDPDEPAGPVCYAFGREESELRPHEKAEEPECEACEGCPSNVFGSAEKGKGKACKNSRRLAVVSMNGLTPAGLKDAEVFFLKVPVTSVKAWAYYVKGLAATQKRPPFGVVTELGVVPDPKTQFKLTFQLAEPLGGEWAGAVLAKRETVMEQIIFPYQANTPKPEPVAAKGKGAAKGKPAPGKPRKF